jgi:hypothetical protein
MYYKNRVNRARWVYYRRIAKSLTIRSTRRSNPQYGNRNSIHIHVYVGGITITTTCPQVHRLRESRGLGRVVSTNGPVSMCGRASLSIIATSVTMPPRQKRMLWRQQSLGSKRTLGCGQETPWCTKDGPRGRTDSGDGRHRSGCKLVSLHG